VALTPSPAGTFTTPDQDESAQLDYWLAQIAAQVESKMLGQTAGARKRVHIATGLNPAGSSTTDAAGYATFNHGAPFTPRKVDANIMRSGATLCVVLSVDNITATQVTVRFTRWDTGALAATQALNASVGLTCWE